MSNDQLETQITELDNLPEHREIVTFMRRSAPLNTSQRTALEDYRDLILEYPVGDLRQHFEHPERPLTVEIGFGMGRSLVLMAKANPERNFVGIEVHVPGIAQCVYEAGMAGLKNLFVLDADAIQVLREMPDNSINCVQLYSPDPWQKKRHFKRRFVSHERMPLVEQKLAKGGWFHAATDWEHYAAWMLDVLDNRPALKNLYGKGNAAPRPDWRPETKFERRGHEAGVQAFKDQRPPDDGQAEDRDGRDPRHAEQRRVVDRQHAQVFHGGDHGHVVSRGRGSDGSGSSSGWADGSQAVGCRLVKPARQRLKFCT